MKDCKYTQIGMIVDKSRAYITLPNKSLPPKQYYSESPPQKKIEDKNSEIKE